MVGGIDPSSILGSGRVGRVEFPKVAGEFAPRGVNIFIWDVLGARTVSEIRKQDGKLRSPASRRRCIPSSEGPYRQRVVDLGASLRHSIRRRFPTLLSNRNS